MNLIMSLLANIVFSNTQQLMRFVFARLNIFHRFIKAFFIHRRLRKILRFSICAGMIYPILQSLKNEFFRCLAE